MKKKQSNLHGCVLHEGCDAGEAKSLFKEGTRNNLELKPMSHYFCCNEAKADEVWKDRHKEKALPIVNSFDGKHKELICKRIVKLVLGKSVKLSKLRSLPEDAALDHSSIERL